VILIDRRGGAGKGVWGLEFSGAGAHACFDAGIRLQDGRSGKGFVKIFTSGGERM
jgi:hypothetical protein